MLLDQFDKIVEKITAVMRAGSCFRMVLYGKSRTIFEADPFDRIIIQVEVSDLDISGILHGGRIYPKSMILCRDLTFARNDILNRMIEPSVPMMHLERRDIIGQRQQLMSHAYSE